MMMTEPLAILEHPQFRALALRRARLSWGLSLILFVAYMAFILAVAFAPAWLGAPLYQDSVLSRGLPLGLGLIVLSFLLTFFYVRACNRDFDPRIAQLRELIENTEHDPGC